MTEIMKFAEEKDITAGSISTAVGSLTECYIRLANANNFFHLN